MKPTRWMLIKHIFGVHSFVCEVRGYGLKHFDGNFICFCGKRESIWKYLREQK